jgi:hypothetical protein
VDGGVPGTDTGYTYSANTVGPDDIFLPAHAYRCEPDGDWTVGTFDPLDMAAADTVQASNAPCPGDPCPADIAPMGGDGVVDPADLFELLGQWGTSGGSGDLDGTPGVDPGDLFILLGAWGDCP